MIGNGKQLDVVVKVGERAFCDEDELCYLEVLCSAAWMGKKSLMDGGAS